jgi:hypothetical protein
MRDRIDAPLSSIHSAPSSHSGEAMMDFRLSTEHEQVRDMVWRFCQAELLQGAPAPPQHARRSAARRRIGGSHGKQIFSVTPTSTEPQLSSCLPKGKQPHATLADPSPATSDP